MDYENLRLLKGLLHGNFYDINFIIEGKPEHFRIKINFEHLQLKELQDKSVLDIYYKLKDSDSLNTRVYSDYTKQQYHNDLMEGVNFFATEEKVWKTYSSEINSSYPKEKCSILTTYESVRYILNKYQAIPKSYNLDEFNSKLNKRIEDDEKRINKSKIELNK